MKKKQRKRAIELISKAELARRRGVARSSATRACAGPLKAAMVGELVDVAHPKVRKWLREGDRAPTSKPETKAAASSGPTAAEFTALTFRMRRAQVEERESRLARQAGNLIALEYVRQHVFGPIEGLFHRLLTDFVNNSASSTLAAAHSGASLLEVQALLRERLSPELKRAKRSMVNGLRNCRTGENPPELQKPNRDFAEDDSGRAARSARSDFARVITSDLRNAATPKVVAAVVKAFGRAAGGRFDDVFALLPQVEQEAEQHVAVMLAGHVTDLLSRTEPDENQENDPS